MTIETEIKIINKFAVEKESRDFYNYITHLNLVNDLNEFLVLPARRHFFYSEEEILKFRGIVNVSKLNYISKIDVFMRKINVLVKRDSYFFGCFINNKYFSYPRFKETRHSFSKFIYAIKLLIDSKMKRLMSENDVKRMFETYEFEIVNMKEIRGVTYFYAKKK